MTLVPARVARSVMHSPTCNPQDDSGFRVMSLVWSVAISFLVLLSFALSNAPAQTTELAIYEEEPFDRITLDAANKNAVIEVFPVDFPDGKIPESPPADAQLRIRLLSRPAEQYDVAWGAIAKYETFPDVVLDEANKLVGQKQFDEAYRCFAWLQREYPEIAGLDAAVGNFVLQDAADAYRDGRWDEAVTLLEEVARRTPNLPGIQRNLAAVTEKLVSQFLKERKFRAVRHFATRYAENTRADELQASAKRWSDLLQKLAEQRRAAAEKYLEQGDLRKAHEATRELLDIWPDLPGAQQLSGTLTQRYPLVTIAVSSFGRPDPLAIDEWTSRRDGRLQWRSLVEFAGYSADGSRYECPLGELTVRDDLRGLTIQLRESDSSLSHINGFDISRRLLWMADASRPEYSPFWSRVAGAISVTDVFNIHVELRHPSLRPEALLQPTLRVAELEDVPSIAPYLQESVDRRMKRFVLNPDYAFGNSTMPAEVVQKLVPDARQAIAALERREVDMIDRLYPADVARLKAKNHLVVQRYAVPTLHVLIPNFSKPFMQSRTFRRALVYAISRDTILKRDLLGGHELAGCQVISGPVPAGVGRDDPSAYAYNTSIEPRAYDPRLAATLIRVAADQLTKVAEKAGEPAPTLNDIVLAHPPNEAAQVATQGIAQYLSNVGLNVTLRELSLESPSLEDQDWDLRYAELTIAEPADDLPRLLGTQGVVRGGTPYLELALRKLQQATTWSQARQILSDIHRLAHEEVTVVPLWQLSEFMAANEMIEGIGNAPVSLFDSVENWRIRSDSPSSVTQR